MESCGLKRLGLLPFTMNLFAQVYCHAFNFSHRGRRMDPNLEESVLICRYQQCILYVMKHAA